MAAVEFAGLELEARDLQGAHVGVVEPDELIREGQLPEEQDHEEEEAEGGGGASGPGEGAH